MFFTRLDGSEPGAELNVPTRPRSSHDITRYCWLLRSSSLRSAVRHAGLVLHSCPKSDYC